MNSGVPGSVLGAAVRGAAAVVAASAASPPTTNGANPMPGTKRQIVHHMEHGHQHLPHSLEVELEISLVIVLVAVHLGALCFWMWLLYASKATKSKGQQHSSGGAARKGWGVTVGEQGMASDTGSPSKRGGRGTQSGAGAASGGGGVSTWRTPGEILASWNKAQEKHRLGKV